MSAPQIKQAQVLRPTAGGAYEAAERFGRELATWSPSLRSPDADLQHAKKLTDARVRDMVRNEGYAIGAVNVNKDSIVGGQYLLNATPNLKVLGADDAWADEFQQVVENRFTMWGDSTENWADAARRNTFTGLVRLAVGVHVLNGEVLATAEWIRKSAQRRPNFTAIQMVNLDRLSNPNDVSDTRTLRRGIEIDEWGAMTAAHIRNGHPYDVYDGREFTWTRVPVRKPWGRLQVLYLNEQLMPEQTRAVSSMVSVLKEMRMTKKFREVTLQNAVVNATYAAAIESELPPDVIWEQMGGGQTLALDNYMGQLTEYSKNAKALALDGVKIPHLFPGTKLNMKLAGTPGGVGTEFEQSLLRYLSAGLGISYEQLSHDYSNTNYSSARASSVETWKTMQARKKAIADRFASMIYRLWLEEEIAAGEVPLPRGMTAASFYEGLNADALSACEWIGAARGQIDEYKETQAADLRIKAMLSTHEDEIARFGKDWRRVFKQRAREKALMEELDIAPVDPKLAAIEAQAEVDDSRPTDKPSNEDDK